MTYADERPREGERYFFDEHEEVWHLTEYVDRPYLRVRGFVSECRDESPILHNPPTADSLHDKDGDFCRSCRDRRASRTDWTGRYIQP